jgi:pyruvate,water dikinase
MSAWLLDLREIDQTSSDLAGGKGANLGELCKMEGIHVPGGFCVTTEAYKKITGNNRELKNLLDELAPLKAEDREPVSRISAKIRTIIGAIPIPQDMAEEIVSYLGKLGEKNAFAVRSSATAEDLPTASFAGQQDTYLNIIGKDAVLRHISRCWASLFSARAVIYRLQNRLDHHKVYLSVVVQKMVFPQAAGILFTADPITSNRKLLSIDAGFGLGEALVSGLTNADNYKICDGRIIGKRISTKKLAVYALQTGGTKEQEIEPERQNRQVLTDEQILTLGRMGRKIEDHFGHPQDIEWCLADDTFYIVQSRPVTTLFPIPEANDQENHIYVSVGHQQMMTDAMKPLGLSFFLLTTRAHMLKAGGRLFVDITQNLASPAGRKTLIDVLGKNDPLIKDALITILEREDFVKLLPEDSKAEGAGKSNKPLPDFNVQIEYDPEIVPGLIRRSETSIETLKQNIRAKSGPDLFDFILEDIPELKKNLSDPKGFAVFMTAMNASSWINEKMQEWLGEKNAADELSQSVPGNITSEMGLALLDIADVVRAHPGLIGYLQDVKDDDFLDELAVFDGGQETRDAICNFLDKYGMRCAGEIDITRPRWSEQPKLLLPLILNSVKRFVHGASHRKFEEGRQDALNKEQALLNRLKQLPDGEQKAGETKRKIELIRNFSGYREYPKYGMISRYFVYKQALLKEAEKLAGAGIVHEKEDIYYLIFEELHEAVRANRLDYQIISKRKEEYKLYEKLTPPRIITSDGEIVAGRYKRENLPAGAIAGLAVSSGVTEGRACVL